jgi:hypothetical protein
MLSLGSTGRAVSFLQARLGVTVTGTFDGPTDAVLRRHQVSKGLKVDGKYGPATNRALTAYTPAELGAISDFGIDAGAFRALIAVETTGYGFLDDGRPKILLERHYVYRLATQAQRDKLPPDLCYPTAGGYGAGAENQWDRFEKVAAVDLGLAIQSCSWGIGQVMGSHFHDLGFTSPADMMGKAALDESEQLEQMARFIVTTNGLRDALNAHDWAKVARTYNGPAYAGNAYDTKLAAAFKALKPLA